MRRMTWRVGLLKDGSRQLRRSTWSQAEGQTEPINMELFSSDERAMLSRMIRVDHAGEYGADRIYEGQYFMLANSSVGPLIKHMHMQEKAHLSKFEELLVRYRVRPTVLLPIWHVAGFALGAGSAVLGKEGAMACTVAVEDVIGHHYNDQIRELLQFVPSDSTTHPTEQAQPNDVQEAQTNDNRKTNEYKQLIETLKQFRDDELEHLDTGLEHGAELAPFYGIMSSAVKVGCQAAIWLSERI